MQVLQYNVAQLMKEQIGATRRHAVETDIAELFLEWPITHPLMGEVHFLRTNRGILVRAELETGVEIACSRCLEPVRHRLWLTFEEVFTPTVDVRTGGKAKLDEEDRALWIDDHHSLDISEIVRQDVLLNITSHVLCREDCLGICPACGQNRNEEPCDCIGEYLDRRWAKLSALR